MSDLIERLCKDRDSLRGVASSVYSDDIQDAIDALEQAQADKEHLGKQLQDVEMALNAETASRLQAQARIDELEGVLREIAAQPNERQSGATQAVGIGWSECKRIARKALGEDT